MVKVVHEKYCIHVHCNWVCNFHSPNYCNIVCCSFQDAVYIDLGGSKAAREKSHSGSVQVIKDWAGFMCSILDTCKILPVVCINTASVIVQVKVSSIHAVPSKLI